MTVMVVEDDRDLRENMSELLEDEGYKPLCAENGLEALYFLRAQQVLPDVILLDLMMPVMSGWQFREQQLQDARLSSIPVIIVSAMDDRGIHAAAKVPKPFDVDHLLATLGRIVHVDPAPLE
ncbi:MAG TPA: response regulator [Anaeromyxobacteraceae bacterium]